MMRRIALLTAAFVVPGAASVWGQTTTRTAEIPAILRETPVEHAARMQWWRDAKFGMFLHWGVYSLLGRGEWVQWYEQIPVEEYAQLAERFRPAKFDATAWAGTAKAAGMKYMVLTARHHDGFCLWDSQASYRDFTSMKSAARRDFILDYTRACREAGLGVGLYYSPLDWRFPGYFFPGLYRSSAEAMKKQTYDQMRELLTRYGKIDILWWDGGGDDWLGFGGVEFSGRWSSRDDQWPQKKHYAGKPLWEGNRLNALARELQPTIILNNRANTPDLEWDGDFHTPEGKVGAFDTARPWETCATLAGSWGWRPNAEVLSLKDCIHLLVKVVVRDGNLLLNVGPTPDGEIEPAQAGRLREIGKWLEEYGESLYGTRGGPFPPGDWGGYTHRENRLFVHVLKWPQGTITIPSPGKKIVKSRCLTGGTVTVKEASEGLVLTVPSEQRQELDTIIEIEFSGGPMSRATGHLRDSGGGA